MIDRSVRPFRRTAAVVPLVGVLSLTASVAAEIGSFCVHHYSAGIDCTAEPEVRIAALSPVAILEDCATGDPATAEAVFEVWIATAGPNRYDIGLFVALNGGSAISGGECLHDYLEPPLSNAPTYSDANGNGILELHGGPWWNGEPFAPNDDCGDIQGGTEALKTQVSFRFACKDSTLDGTVDFSTCTSWSAGTTSRCSGLSDAYPPAANRCHCNFAETGVPMPGAGRVANLTFARVGAAQLQLSWGASCSVSDDDYAVYEGSLGEFTSHQSVVCTTGGATSVTIPAAPEDTYYLVVPRNAVREGSYGANGAGAERPPSTNACAPQSLEGSCS